MSQGAKMSGNPRTEEICRLYTSGMTMQEVGERFSISRERVRQILRKAGVFKKDRVVVKSDRGEFLGVNLSSATKDALKTQAQEQGVSMSRLVSDKIDEMVKEADGVEE